MSNSNPATEHPLHGLSCDHNGFAHRIFPRIVRRDGAELLAMLAPTAPSLPHMLGHVCRVVNEIFPTDPESDILKMQDIRVTEEQLTHSKVLLFTLTPPKHPIGVYFIALQPPQAENLPARYFTFERLDPDEESAVLCEWVVDEEGNASHRNIGGLGEPTVEAFKDALKFLEMLEREAPRP
jgi:hypothetical protein